MDNVTEHVAAIFETFVKDTEGVTGPKVYARTTILARSQAYLTSLHCTALFPDAAVLRSQARRLRAVVATRCISFPAFCDEWERGVEAHVAWLLDGDDRSDSCVVGGSRVAVRSADGGGARHVWRPWKVCDGIEGGDNGGTEEGEEGDENEKGAAEGMKGDQHWEEEEDGDWEKSFCDDGDEEMEDEDGELVEAEDSSSGGELDYSDDELD